MKTIDQLKSYYAENPAKALNLLPELFKQADEGKIVELPCKVGDTVWAIKAVFSFYSKPMEEHIERIIISTNEILICCVSGHKFRPCIIGKTVFLTRAESEQALKEREPCNT